jgi:hypothetical protein
MSLHDLDRLRRTSIADVHAANDPNRTGDQLLDFRITATAEGTVHCSSKHVTTSDITLR